MSELEKELEAAARSWRGRVLDFLGRFLIAFATVLIAAPSSQWVTAGVWSVIFSAAVTTVMELSPSIPWRQVLQILDQHGVLPEQVDQPQKGSS